MNRAARSLAFAILACLAYPAAASQEAMTKFLTLGTASESGVFHPVGTRLCEVINHNRMADLVRCIAYTSGGSVYNIHAMLSTELDLAISRSDLAFQAYNGEGAFASAGPARELRVIASLYGMPVTVIARRDAGVKTIEDIRGKRLNLGNRGSGQRTIAEMLLKSLGLGTGDFAATTELTTSAMGKAFCEGKIDVMLEALGNPAAFYKRAIEECDGVIVPISTPVLENILKSQPRLGRLEIPGGIYRGFDDPIPSFGFTAVLLTSTRIDDEAIYRVTRSLFSRLPEFRQSHPVLERLKTLNMVRDGITIPFHPGSLRYLASQGMP